MTIEIFKTQHTTLVPHNARPLLVHYKNPRFLLYDNSIYVDLVPTTTRTHFYSFKCAQQFHSPSVLVGAVASSTCQSATQLLTTNSSDFCEICIHKLEVPTHNNLQKSNSTHRVDRWIHLPSEKAEPRAQCNLSLFLSLSLYILLLSLFT